MKENRTNLGLVPHGAAAENHDASSRLCLEAFQRGALGSEKTTNKVRLENRMRNKICIKRVQHK